MIQMHFSNDTAAGLLEDIMTVTGLLQKQLNGDPNVRPAGEPAAAQSNVVNLRTAPTPVQGEIVGGQVRPVAVAEQTPADEVVKFPDAAPRPRGRPRKVVETVEATEAAQPAAEPAGEPAAVATAEDCKAAITKLVGRVNDISAPAAVFKQFGAVQRVRELPESEYGRFVKACAEYQPGAA